MPFLLISFLMCLLGKVGKISTCRIHCIAHNMVPCVHVAVAANYHPPAAVALVPDADANYKSNQGILTAWCTAHGSLNVREVLEHDPEAYYSKEELLEPLHIMYNSLIETKDDSIANGRLLDVIRQVSTPVPAMRHI